MTFKAALALLPLLVLYTAPISGGNPYLRMTFYDVMLLFVIGAVAYLRQKFRIHARGRDWTLVSMAYFGVLALVLAKEPDFIAALPAIGGLILGAGALFVVIEHPTRFLAARLVDMWLIGLAVTAVIAAGQTAGSGRAVGLFRFPNELGTYGALTIALLIAAHYFGLTSTRKIAAGVAGAGVVLLASGGRASIVTALALLALYFGLYVFTSSHNFARAVTVVVPIVLLSILITSATSFNITETIAESAGVSSQRVVEAWEQREVGSFFVENWDEAWTLFRGSPAIGWPISQATVDSSVLGGEYSVHNTPLSLLVNYGLIGAALLTAPFFMLKRNGLLPPVSLMIVLGVGLLPLALYHDLAESRTVWLALAIIVRAGWEQRRELALAAAERRAEVDARIAAAREESGNGQEEPSRKLAPPPSRAERRLRTRRRLRF